MFLRTDLIVLKCQLGLLTLIAIYFDGLILVLASRQLDGRIWYFCWFSACDATKTVGLFYMQTFISLGDDEGGCGSCCTWLLTVLSFLLVIITVPFSLCLCIRVRNYVNISNMSCTPSYLWKKNLKIDVKCDILHL